MIDNYDKRPYYKDSKNRRRSRRVQAQKDKRVFDKYKTIRYPDRMKRLREQLSLGSIKQKEEM